MPESSTYLISNSNKSKTHLAIFPSYTGFSIKYFKGSIFAIDKTL